jgi:hypothetical protein
MAEPPEPETYPQRPQRTVGEHVARTIRARRGSGIAVIATFIVVALVITAIP